MIDSEHLLSTRQVAEFVANGVLRFDGLVPFLLGEELLGWNVRPDPLVRAKSAAETAVGLDRSDPFGHHVLAMVYRHLGISPQRTFNDLSGRPRYLLEERGVIKELI